MKRNRGFTLIEILVVVSIIGLLASIVFVSLKGRREEAGLAGAKQFAQSMYNAIGADLVALWRFEEGSGSTASDFSGYQNTGTLISGPVFQDANTCKLGFGGCMNFDGIDDYVSVGDKSILSFPSQIFTFSFWMKADNTTSPIGVLGKRGGPWEYSCYGNSGGSVGCSAWASGGGSSYGSVSAVYNTNWTYFVWTGDGVNAKLYKDGLLVSTAAKVAGVNMSDTSSPFEIGRGGASAGIRYMNGKIDEVAVYARTLTSYEIQQMYAKGLPRHELASD